MYIAHVTVSGIGTVTAIINDDDRRVGEIAFMSLREMRLLYLALYRIDVMTIIDQRASSARRWIITRDPMRLHVTALEMVDDRLVNVSFHSYDRWPIIASALALDECSDDDNDITLSTTTSDDDNSLDALIYRGGRVIGKLWISDIDSLQHIVDVFHCEKEGAQ